MSDGLSVVRRQVEDFLARVGPQVTAVQVLVSQEIGEETHSFEMGYGNWWARYGQCRAWLKKCEALEAATVLSRPYRIEDEPEAGG